MGRAWGTEPSTEPKMGARLGKAAGQRAFQEREQQNLGGWGVGMSLPHATWAAQGRVRPARRATGCATGAGKEPGGV